MPRPVPGGAAPSQMRHQAWPRARHRTRQPLAGSGVAGSDELRQGLRPTAAAKPSQRQGRSRALFQPGQRHPSGVRVRCSLALDRRIALWDCGCVDAGAADKNAYVKMPTPRGRANVERSTDAPRVSGNARRGTGDNRSDWYCSMSSRAAPRGNPPWVSGTPARPWTTSARRFRGSDILPAGPAPLRGHLPEGRDRSRLWRRALELRLEDAACAAPRFCRARTTATASQRPGHPRGRALADAHAEIPAKQADPPSTRRSHFSLRTVGSLLLSKRLRYGSAANGAAVQVVAPVAAPSECGSLDSRPWSTVHTSDSSRRLHRLDHWGRPSRRGPSPRLTPGRTTVPRRPGATPPRRIT